MNISNFPFNEKVCFTNYVLDETIKIPKNMPDIENIYSFIIDPKIVNIKIIDGLEVSSNEGKFLTGKKAIITIKLKHKFLYISDSSEHNIHVFENETYHSTQIAIPRLIKGSDPTLLIRNKYLIPNINIEETIVKKINKRLLYKNIIMYIKLDVTPTYEICYSIDSNEYSNLNICYEDFNHNSELLSYKNSKILRPSWSPNGLSIAYLLKSSNSYMLNLYNIKNNKSIILSNPSIFDSISSYCWSNYGDKIIFSAYIKNEKELFSIDINTMELKQLTYGNTVSKSLNPKHSPNGNKIAFLKSISKVPYLYIMSIDGLDCERIETNGYVKDFHWSLDGRYITYITNDDDNILKLYTFDLINFTHSELLNINNITDYRLIKFAPNSSYISFIGSNDSTDDLYIYNLKTNDFINLTNNHRNVHIESYTWNLSSSKLFFSSNKLYTYNVYLLDLETLKSFQITNGTYNGIELSYRPKLK